MLTSVQQSALDYHLHETNLLTNEALVPSFGLLWPYLKAIFRHGLHNVPAQVLYLVKRQTLLTSLQCLLGIGGYFWLMPLLPSALQAFLMSLFVAGMCLYMLTAHYMRELLYVYEESR